MGNTSSFRSKAFPAAILSAATVFGTALVGAGAPASAEDAAPKLGARWTLSMTHGPLKRILVDDGGGRKVTHFYMTMKVSNTTGHPRDWRPLVVGKTDTLHPDYVAGGFSTALEEIRRVERDATLEPVEKRPEGRSRIAAGETKNLVAVFGPVNPEWSRFRIEISGLVDPHAILKVQKYKEGEDYTKGRYVVSDTVYLERNESVMRAMAEEAKKEGSEVPKPTPEYHEVVEDRAWVIEHRRSGDEFRPDDDPIDFVRERWEVLRDPKIIRVIPSKI
jgi:hypothetical protein